jgi:tetratricopeptide (TPR) repeat protein
MILLTFSVLSVLAMQPTWFDLNRQGRLLLDQHRYSTAVRVFQQAVDRAETELGAQDPATAMILRNLALAYVQSGDSTAAEQSAKLAFSIIESRFGPADPGLTPILNVLAECYASTGRVQDAQRTSERAVSIGPSAGVHYGIALHNLGALREYSGDLESAAFWYRRAIAVKIETLGPAHPYVALSRAAFRRVQHSEHLVAHTTGPIKLEQAGE